GCVRLHARRGADRARQGDVVLRARLGRSSDRRDRHSRGLSRATSIGYNVRMSSYLQDLTARLADGVARLPAGLRERQTRYLASKQNADGGFSGREGESDLY